MRILLLAILAAACGRLATHRPAPAATPPARAELQATYDQRLEAFAAATKDRAGWPSVTDCDGTLWAAVACAGGADAQISLAEWAPGELHRRPAASGECYPAGSSSTISRDPIAPYATCAIRHGDRGALERLLAYSDAHGGYIGEPKDLGLTFLGPNLDGILSRAVEGMGGGFRVATANAIVEAPGAVDYQRHNQAEEILLSAAVAGAATDLEVTELRGLVGGWPEDPFFEAALGVYTGDFAKATAELLNPYTQVPSYVRGDQAGLFADAWWLRAARVVLDHTKE